MKIPRVYEHYWKSLNIFALMSQIHTPIQIETDSQKIVRIHFIIFSIKFNTVLSYNPHFQPYGDSVNKYCCLTDQTITFETRYNTCNIDTNLA